MRCIVVPPTGGMCALGSRRSKRKAAVETRPDVRVYLPPNLGLSDKEIDRLIESWIVPQLIRVFITESDFGTSSQSEKPDECSGSKPPSRIHKHRGAQQ